MMFITGSFHGAYFRSVMLLVDWKDKKTATCGDRSEARRIERPGAMREEIYTAYAWHDSVSSQKRKKTLRVCAWSHTKSK